MSAQPKADPPLHRPVAVLHWLLGTTHKCQTCVLPRCTSQLHNLLLTVNGTAPLPTPTRLQPKADPVLLHRQMASLHPLLCNKHKGHTMLTTRGLPCSLQQETHHLLLHPQVAPLDQLLRLCQRHEAP